MNKHWLYLNRYKQYINLDEVNHIEHDLHLITDRYQSWHISSDDEKNAIKQYLRRKSYGGNFE